MQPFRLRHLQSCALRFHSRCGTWGGRKFSPYVPARALWFVEKIEDTLRGMQRNARRLADLRGIGAAQIVD